MTLRRGDAAPPDAAGPFVRPLESAPAGHAGAVGLPQGRRRLRPPLRLLRHPDAFGAASGRARPSDILAEANARRGRGRSPGAGDRARRPGPRLLGARPSTHWARERLEALDEGAAQPLVELVESARRCGRARPAALPLSLGAHRRADRRRPRHRRSLLRPLAPARRRARSLARMRRWGDGERFLERIGGDPRLEDPTRPSGPRSSSATPARPRTTRRAARLPRGGPARLGRLLHLLLRGGHPRRRLDDQVARELALERLRECTELQDAITAGRRDALVGSRRSVLIDAPGVGRTVHEAPEIDGVVRVPASLGSGPSSSVTIVESRGRPRVAVPVGMSRDPRDRSTRRRAR